VIAKAKCALPSGCPDERQLGSHFCAAHAVGGTPPEPLDKVLAALEKRNAEQRKTLAHLERVSARFEGEDEPVVGKYPSTPPFIKAGRMLKGGPR
jgi:hypothetical protein